MTVQDQQTGTVAMRPTRAVMTSNTTGMGGNMVLTATLMFMLSRFYGGYQNIPHDWLEFVPYMIPLIGMGTHALSEWWTRDRHVASAVPAPVVIVQPPAGD